MAGADAAWSPYLVGALIGVLATLTLWISGKPLGASSAYAKVAGMLGTRLWKRTRELKYYQENKPEPGWEVALIPGVVLGAFLSAWLGGELTGQWVPSLWAERFGDALFPRVITAFIGGAIMAFGARLAGACTSGHGISGTAQLSVGSWIALACFFIGGSATALLMFG